MNRNCGRQESVAPVICAAYRTLFIPNDTMNNRILQINGDKISTRFCEMTPTLGAVEFKRFYTLRQYR